MNCVLIGRGYWGKILEKYINQSKYFDLVGVYTRSTSDLSYEEFLKSVVVDAVFICSPVSSHYEHVKYALLQGKHVFCEKPFTNNVSESDELYELAREKNLCLYVDYIYACSPSIIKLVDIMPRIGKVQKVEFEMTQMGKFYADCDVLGNIAGGLLGTLLDNEAAKTTEIDILLTLHHAFLDARHELLHNGGHVLFAHTSSFNNFVDDICLCHTCCC